MRTCSCRHTACRYVLDLLHSFTPGACACAGTIFAYGQTGTGKSHTMQGRDDPPELRGITPSAFNYVFQQISNVRKYSLVAEP